MGFRSETTSLPDLLLVHPDRFGDSRGFFMELFNRQTFDQIGLKGVEFVQDNLSASSRGALRGLHFQTPPHAQGKLVTVLEGAVLDVAVDLRKDSPTYGKWELVEITADQPKMLYVPPGFAHGFQVISERCLFLYKVTKLYAPTAEGGIRWDDPDLGIPWADIPPILSGKDQTLPLLKDFDSPF